MVNEEALCIAVSILAAALSTAGTGLFVVGIEKDNDVLQDIGVGLETLAIILAVWGCIVVLNSSCIACIAAI